MGSLRLAMLSDILEEVLPKHKNPLADLIEPERFLPEYPPRCLSDAKPPLKFRERLELIGPNKARQEL